MTVISLKPISLQATLKERALTTAISAVSQLRIVVSRVRSSTQQNPNKRNWTGAMKQSPIPDKAKILIYDADWKQSAFIYVRK